MPYFGSHLSSTGGYTAMGETSLEMGEDTFAFFPRPPRGGRMRKLDPEDMNGLVDLLAEHHFGPLVAHAPYVYNLSSNKEENVRRTRDNLLGDIERLDLIPGCLYNIHPGAHVGQGVEAGVQLIADGLNEVLRPDQSTVVLLETMAGKGTELGARFEELAMVVERVELDQLLGVCLDSCHVSDGGYDVAADLDAVLDEFDATVGLERLRAIHLNDSKNPCGSHKDRHERIGAGSLALATFQAFVTNPRLQHLPMILETPNEREGYVFEVSLLRSLSAGMPLDEAQALLDEHEAKLAEEQAGREAGGAAGAPERDGE
ncbi:deoxyribonuclease IV [Olsenella sp. YH-ols2217]|uniref:Probable endonuclease 4 n=1 Tax=Kribbibacterium absianum TaxID=3044210 RepID=A0ABT6ZIR5_9ACTN|nr:MULTISPECIES: deoxyribonuclease IV [unclassified Olsenella]MDJ1121451.1 deoxyribonuclease IV [Olsenella sp. YH-ols2216]MDJ1128941.1 deoxyribonuclease IV [Olsenella sp. YH-ols2217]